MHVVDDISLAVEPSGELEIGMTVNVSCTIRYGGPGPDKLSQDQEPDVKLMLDNDELPGGRPYYIAPATDSFHRKTRVIFDK